MLMMSFVNALINHRLIFFNTYVWAAIALFSLIVSIRAIKVGPNLYESIRLHSVLSYALLALSIISILFIIARRFLSAYII